MTKQELIEEMKNRKKPELWDIETNRFNEISFSIYLEYIDNINISLQNRMKDHRASYTMLSEFVRLSKTTQCHNQFQKKAKIIIRNDKIDKILGVL